MASIINASSTGSGGIVQTADASGVLQLQSNGTTALTVSGSAVTFASQPAGTFAGTGPAFSVYLSTNQSLTAAAYTVIPFDVEEFDTASCFSTSTYRFTPTVAGYYALSGSFTLTATAIPLIFVYKNGATYKRGAYTFNSNAFQINMSCLVYLNGSTDYVQLIARTEAGSTLTGDPTATWFQGYMVRAA